MSSMRNAVQRRNHKERAQPKERQRWGLLEKHKDYSLRAQDYNTKKARIKALRTRAAERNPDEFHHGMLSSHTSKGRRIADRGNPILSQDAVKLLKTQDSSYLKAMIQRTRKKIERLEEDFVLQPPSGNLKAGISLDVRDVSNKILFCEGAAAQHQTRSDLQQTESPPPAPMSARSPLQHRPKSTKQFARDRRLRKDKLAWQKAADKAKEMRRTQLKALKARKTDLFTAEEELEKQRAKISNSIGGMNRDGIKFKMRERKK